MLQEEIYRLAKAVDYLPEQQAIDILVVALERLKEDVSAMIADIWVRAPAEGGLSILEPFASRADEGRPARGRVVVTERPESLLAWVVEHEEPLWLDDISVGSGSAVNRLNGQTIPANYFKVDNRTRSFAAVPIRFREQLRGVLSVEAAIAGRITRAHLDTMVALEGPVGILLWKSSISRENFNHTQEAIHSFRQQNSKSINSLNPYRTGFIARPFAVEFEFLEKAAKEIFRRKQIRVNAYQHPIGKGLVVTQMLAQIHAAHFGIADITGLNANVLIEFGAMASSGKPILVFRKKDESSALPFDMAGYQYYEYSIHDGSIITYSTADSTSRISLEDTINSFIGGTLFDEKGFVDAKEWHED
jgi:hypothetical protein